MPHWKTGNILSCQNDLVCTNAFAHIAIILVVHESGVADGLPRKEGDDLLPTREWYSGHSLLSLNEKK